MINPTHATVRDALVKSIEHWNRLATAQTVDDIVNEGTGVYSCSLCTLFFSTDCAGCPIRARVGEPHCEFPEYREAHELQKDPPFFRPAALKMVNFLHELLQEHDAKPDKAESHYPKEHSKAWLVLGRHGPICCGFDPNVPMDRAKYDLGLLIADQEQAIIQRRHLETKAELLAQPGAMKNSEARASGTTYLHSMGLHENEPDRLMTFALQMPRPGGVYFKCEADLLQAIETVGRDRVIAWLKEGDI